MTRINTNVASLTAEASLNASNNTLNNTLTRLSTGLRINSGKDDPAGLIAATALGNDITSTQQAISNSQMADQMISTADSALGQVSTLLTNIRGLVTQAASTGSESSDQIAANQLQVDSSLDAINRIAATTTFQGQNLLDGSLAFQTAADTTNHAADNNFSLINNLNISQASLTDLSQALPDAQAVNVNVTTAATQASIAVAGLPALTPATNSNGDYSFSRAATAQASHAYSLTTSGGTDAVTIAAKAGGAYDGTLGNGITGLQILTGQANAGVSVHDGILQVSVTQADNTAKVSDVEAAINGSADFTATGGTAADTLAAQASATALSGGTGSYSAGTIHIISNTAGTATPTITFDTSGTVPTGVDSSGNLTVAVTANETYAQIAQDISQNSNGEFTASLTSSSGVGNYLASDTTPAAAAMPNPGTAALGGLGADVTFSVTGDAGTQVFSFKQGTGVSQIVSAINALTAATGVSATGNTAGTAFTLNSVDYGSAASAQIKVLSGSLTAALGSGTTATGTDIVGTVNGIQGNGNGNTLSVNSSGLQASMNVQAGFSGNVYFDITGGGAKFQLGADVNNAQQARIGIQRVATDSLGGSAGWLYQIGSSGTANLSSDPSTAASIVDQASAQVANLRGSLGAFQQATVDSNITALTSAVTNLTAAQSQIQDADFAAESANLTRAQILVQSGTTVLGIANKNPENVLSLLR
jgi:flagellin